MKTEYTFMDKTNRDKKAQELRTEGYTVKKRSSRNQQLHPMYVEDYPHKLSDEDKGFGNTLYRTWFSHLYYVAIVGEVD